ncbi:hypothetical protein EDB86DRAFT_3173390 [Lactarius hatsudake]|nr:hypothetical protein EDB86DRAFT_3173390 [Lactarius hatsudake]
MPYTRFREVSLILAGSLTNNICATLELGGGGEIWPRITHKKDFEVALTPSRQVEIKDIVPRPMIDDRSSWRSESTQPEPILAALADRSTQVSVGRCIEPASFYSSRTFPYGDDWLDGNTFLASLSIATLFFATASTFSLSLFGFCSGLSVPHSTQLRKAASYLYQHLRDPGGD